MSCAWMCWMKNTSAPSSCWLARCSTRRSNARPAVRTRSIGRISRLIERIGLIFSAEPIHACAPPIRPPRRRYSSVSTAKMIVIRSRSRRADVGGARQVGARRAIALLAAIAISPWPGGAGVGVQDLDPLRRDAALDQRVARLPGRLHGARDAAREVDREHVVARLQQRLVDGQEVADRGLRRARQVGRRAHVVVERVVVGQVALAVGAAGPVHVQRDQVQLVAPHDLRREVVRRVGDHCDAGHGGQPILAPWLGSS